MKIRKRLFLTALAAVFAGTMSFSAFAVETTTIEVTYVEPTIEVTVPQTGKAYINPYALPVQMSGGAVTVAGQQIASDPMVIINRSEVDLEVRVEVTGTVTGATPETKMLLVSEKMDSDDTGKKAFVYLQMERFTQGTDTSPENALKNLEAVPITYRASRDVLVLDGKKSTLESTAPMATLLKANSGTPQVGSNAAFRLTGFCSKTPKIAWSAADKITASVAFTFSPPSK